MAWPPAARSIGEHTAATARTTCGCAVAHLLRPAQQGIATQRHAHRNDGATVLRAELLQYPADLGKVARVVGTRRVVELTTAAPEMRHGVGHAMGAGEVGKGFGVVAAGAAFQAVEQDQQRATRRQTGVAASVAGSSSQSTSTKSASGVAQRSRRYCGCGPNTRREYNAGQMVCRLPPGSQRGAT